MVGNVVGHAEPHTSRSKAADFNPRCARLLNIITTFSQQPHLELCRAAVLAALPPNLRQSSTPQIEGLITDAQTTPLGDHPYRDCETLALIWLLDDARHIHLQLDPKNVAARLHQKLGSIKSARFSENAKLFTFVQAALDRYERFA